MVQFVHCKCNWCILILSLDIALVLTSWLPGFARVPYHATIPSPCLPPYLSPGKMSISLKCCTVSKPRWGWRLKKILGRSWHFFIFYPSNSPLSTHLGWGGQFLGSNDSHIYPHIIIYMYVPNFFTVRRSCQKKVQTDTHDYLCCS